MIRSHYGQGVEIASMVRVVVLPLSLLHQCVRCCCGSRDWVPGVINGGGGTLVDEAPVFVGDGPVYSQPTVLELRRYPASSSKAVALS